MSFGTSFLPHAAKEPLPIAVCLSLRKELVGRENKLQTFMMFFPRDSPSWAYEQLSRRRQNIGQQKNETQL